MTFGPYLKLCQTANPGQDKRKSACVSSTQCLQVSIIPVLLIQRVQETHLNAQSIIAGAVISIQAQTSLTPQ